MKEFIELIKTHKATPQIVSKALSRSLLWHIMNLQNKVCEENPQFMEISFATIHKL